MRSFTQLLRRASSRGSHNIEESKDEPVDFNTLIRVKNKPAEHFGRITSDLQSSFSKNKVDQ